MTEVILHHYENSPFGQAMRLALGLKGIDWKSVQQPDITPKPDLSALTGGLWFMPAVGVALGTNPDIVSDEFWEDRAKRFGMDRRKFLPMVPHLTGQFEAGAALVAETLADGRDYISGDNADHADLMLYMNIRFANFAGKKPSDFGADVAAWYDRIDGIGYGNFEEWTGQQAIDSTMPKHQSRSAAVRWIQHPVFRPVTRFP